MTRSAIALKALRGTFVASALTVVLGCSSTGSNEGSGGTASGSGGHPASGGAASGGAQMGGANTNGGFVNQNGGAQMGGASQGGNGSGGTTPSRGGTTSAGGASGGAPSGGTSAGGASAGAAGASAGATSRGGAGGAGGGSGGSGGASGGSGGGGSFDPCPASEPCKILPLGDSITWGINYGGGYRIKLFTHTSADNKKVTFVGYDTANPPNSAALSKLGNASSMWVGKHEGHSGWVIQEDDDLVTGKSTANNDSVNYKGKKVVADFGPHIVLVHLGTNDMYKGPNGAPDRLGTLIDHIVADAPNALVVVASIVPFPSGASAVTTFNKAVPGVVQQRASAGKHVIYVDMFAALTTADLGSDMVHPNEGGYEKMAVVWYNAIKPYLH